MRITSIVYRGSMSIWLLSKSIAITCLSLLIPSHYHLPHSRPSSSREREASLAKTLTPFGTSLGPQGGFCGAGVFHRIHFHERAPSPCSSKFCTWNHPDETLMHFATFLHQFYLLCLVISYSFFFACHMLRKNFVVVVVANDEKRDTIDHV